MNTLSRGLLILTASMFLTHCSGQNDDQRAEAESLIGARAGAAWAFVIGRLSPDQQVVRPAALLSAYITEYLVHTSVFQSAVAGIEAQLQLLFDDEYEQEESFVLLEDLGSLLQVDIADMLNRATDRPAAFDAYLESLADIGGRSQGHLERLEQELDDIQTERRLQRREAARIQSSLNQAIRMQDYSSAGDLQRDIIEAEAELARIESQEDEHRSVVRLFEDLLEIAEERLLAMRQNREPLIAGLRVIEVPGIEDLGLIEEGMRRNRRESTFGEILVDPSL